MSNDVDSCYKVTDAELARTMVGRRTASGNWRVDLGFEVTDADMARNMVDLKAGFMSESCEFRKQIIDAYRIALNQSNTFQDPHDIFHWNVNRFYRFDLSGRAGFSHELMPGFNCVMDRQKDAVFYSSHQYWEFAPLAHGWPDHTQRVPFSRAAWLESYQRLDAERRLSSFLGRNISTIILGFLPAFYITMDDLVQSINSTYDTRIGDKLVLTRCLPLNCDWRGLKLEPRRLENGVIQIYPRGGGRFYR